jgi:choline dehydrogenase
MRVRTRDMNESTDNRSTLADYVVVGTGSAGSVRAERLSGDARNWALVVEAGGKDTAPR